MPRGFLSAEGLRCGTEVMSQPARPTAIVAGNDMLALGCYTALERLGLSCPEDVSVVGFNDMPFMDRLSPPLTTVRIPHYDLGTQAAELLLERMSHDGAPLKIVLLAPQLVVRGSTGPAPVVARPTGRRRAAAPACESCRRRAWLVNLVAGPPSSRRSSAGAGR